MAGYYGQYGTAELQPYQEQLQGSQATSTASPDDLKAFYEVMQRKDLERKKSNKTQRKSTLWSRKSVKRSGDQATSPTAGPSSQPQRPTAASLDTARDNAGHPPAGRDVREMERLEEQRDIVTPLSTSRSIIPEALNELPAWYPKDDSAFRMRYNLHNPVGPRRYYNHHLIPPSHKKPSSRPPSIFSPSFPPMATSSQDSEDLTRLPGPSRTPSNSPLPTPSSSQACRDVGKPRSRKTSQTAHDGVDLLDVSDPWGTNWHHQSPYDVGLTAGTVTIDVQENGQRPRHTSMTTRETRRRTVTPSPLSQSTSAVHLSPNPDGARIPRKLSKRRTSALGIFGNSDSKDRSTLSAPSTPLDDTGSDSKHMGLIVPSSAPPSSYKSPSVMTKKERRGSVLGRLVKKFSILRRPQHDKNESLGDAAMVVLRSESPEKSPQRRVPPPSIESPSPVPDEPPTPPTPEPEPVPTSRVSISSIEQPFSMGKLTIANPDAPDSDASTPQQRHIPLPSTGKATTAEPYAPQHPPSVPSSQSSTLHTPSVNAPSMGSVSPVPSSSMQVLSETMKPEVRDGPSPPQPSVPHRSSREISPPKPAEPSQRSSSGSIAPQTSKRSSQSNGKEEISVA
ncbi:hypothetical protein BDZ89DRAFT_346113 [Hymenopellis radicata]|nr:hypothetical protein BDZ89DRAFT_346113 [Hymenopellis radicata]